MSYLKGNIKLIHLFQVFIKKLTDVYLYFFISLFLTNTAHAINKINEGDILIANYPLSLFKANPKTGQRSLISDFSPYDKGHSSILGVAAGCNKEVFVIISHVSNSTATILKIDSTTGASKPFANFNSLNFPSSLEIDSKGDIIFSASDNTGHLRRLVNLNVKTKKLKTVTDLKNSKQGFIDNSYDFAHISGFVIEPSGNIITGVNSGYAKQYSSIFRVNNKTGNRKMVSDFSNEKQGNNQGRLWNSYGMAIENSGNILTASSARLQRYTENSLLLRANLLTGQRTIVNNFGNINEQDHIIRIAGVAVEKNGQIIVGAQSSFSNLGNIDKFLIFRVNPKNGKHTVISDSSKSTQGSKFGGIADMRVVPNKFEQICDK